MYIELQSTHQDWEVLEPSYHDTPQVWEMSWVYLSIPELSEMLPLFSLSCYKQGSSSKYAYLAQNRDCVVHFSKEVVCFVKG